MAKNVRYTLASVCFAASVACLALWWRSYSVVDMLQGPIYIVPGRVMTLNSSAGVGAIVLIAANSMASGETEWVHFNRHPLRLRRHGLARNVKANRHFEVLHNELTEYGVRFPISYPALVFALAGVGVIRFRRQFSIRSALIAFAVVAALLAMPLTL